MPFWAIAAPIISSALGSAAGAGISGAMRARGPGNTAGLPPYEIGDAPIVPQKPPAQTNQELSGTAVSDALKSSLQSMYKSRSAELKSKVIGWLKSQGVKALEGITGAATTALTQSAFGRIQRGLSPDPGFQMRRFMDNAFPGTNAWERLRSGQTNMPMQVAERQTQMASALKQQELGLNESLAGVSARAQLANNFGKYGPKYLARMSNFVLNGTDPRLHGLRGQAQNEQMMAEVAVEQMISTQEAVRVQWHQLNFQQRKFAIEHALNKMRAASERISAVGDTGWAGLAARELRSRSKEWGIDHKVFNYSEEKFGKWLDTFAGSLAASPVFRPRPPQGSMLGDLQRRYNLSRGRGLRPRPDRAPTELFRQGVVK